MNKLPQSFANLAVRRELLAPLGTLFSQPIREKHRNKPRGYKHHDGHTVPAGRPLFYQHKLLFHPGLNVGIGSNLTLYAMEAGKVRITCELAEPNWSMDWMKRFYGHVEGRRFYKKYFHVIPQPQSLKFNLVEQN